LRKKTAGARNTAWESQAERYSPIGSFSGTAGNTRADGWVLRLSRLFPARGTAEGPGPRRGQAVLPGATRKPILSSAAAILWIVWSGMLNSPHSIAASKEALQASGCAMGLLASTLRALSIARAIKRNQEYFRKTGVGLPARTRPRIVPASYRPVASSVHVEPTIHYSANKAHFSRTQHGYSWAARASQPGHVQLS
jgi:hypothetical protein